RTGPGRVPAVRLRRVSHLQAGGRERQRRAGPRQAEGARREGQQGLRDRLHPRVDREAGRLPRARVPRRDAAYLRWTDLREAARRPRAVSGGRLMTDVAHAHTHHDAPPPPTGIHRWTAPGWLRVLWVTPIFIGIGFLIPGLIRWLADWQPIWKGQVLLTVQLVTAPLGFLVGIGGFDYWAHYAIGRPTLPEDHSGHGAKSWRDYFRVNTDHKVIGIQYVVTTIIFFCIGGLLAMLFRAELAQPGDQYFNPQTFNVLISNHAALMIFLFVIPAFA